jgi:hypothetical protein
MSGYQASLSGGSIVSGSSYSFADNYQKKLLQQNQTAATLGALITQNSFPTSGGTGSSSGSGSSSTSSSKPLPIKPVVPTGSLLPLKSAYFPVLVDNLGATSLYISSTDKPAEFDYITNYDPASGETYTDWKLQLNVSSVNLNNKARIINVLDPISDGDVATKRYVLANVGANWWTNTALGNVDMSGNILQNTLLTLQEPCLSKPYITPDGELILKGNGCSLGKWFFRMTEDITTIAISDIAEYGEFTLILKGSSLRDMFVNFVGADKHQCFTTWAGKTRIGKSTFTSFRILYYDSHYLIHMLGYN